MYILTSTSTARPCAGGPLQAVSWCLLPAPWSSAAALPWRTEDWRPQQTAILRNVGRKPRVGLAQWASLNLVRVTYHPVMRLCCGPAKGKETIYINHITSIFIFQFHSTYIKYDLDIEIGL